MNKVPLLTMGVATAGLAQTRAIALMKAAGKIADAEYEQESDG